MGNLLFRVQFLAAIFTRFGSVVAVFALAWIGSWDASFADGPLTPFQLNRMTNDPQTNPTLARFTERLEPAAAEALKNIELVSEVSHHCPGVSVDEDVLRRYSDSKMANVSDDQRKDAQFLADKTFNYLIFSEVEELCAGIDYMFGPNGALIAGVVSKETITPRLASPNTRNPNKNSTSGAPEGDSAASANAQEVLNTVASFEVPDTPALSGRMYLPRGPISGWSDLDKSLVPIALRFRCQIVLKLAHEAPAARFLPPGLPDEEEAALGIAVCLLGHLPADWPERTKWRTIADVVLSHARQVGATLTLPKTIAR